MIRVSTGGFYLSIVYVNANEKASVCFLFHTLVKKEKKRGGSRGGSWYGPHICLLIACLFFLRTCSRAKVQSVYLKQML